jgi:hypothetical protein
MKILLFSLTGTITTVSLIFSHVRYPLILHVRSVLQDTEVHAGKVANIGVVLEHKGRKRNTRSKLNQAGFIKLSV